MSNLLFRACRVTVNDKAVEQLRVGFTIEKSLKARERNKAEIAIYNLAEASRNALHKADSVKVLVEAGYRDTGLSTLFLGELREAFSRPMEDGNWVTIVRSGDGDKAARKTRKTKSTAGIRPGISFDRVISDLAKQMGVGIGNVGALLRAGELDPDGLGKAFAKGFNAAGLDFEGLQKIVRSSGHEISVQDGQLQAIKRGATVPGVKATFLSRFTGLEGTPEVDAKGILKFRARILPGLEPGYPIEVETVASTGSGIWRIEKVRAVGDTKEQDWSVEGEAREITA